MRAESPFDGSVSSMQVLGACLPACFLLGMLGGCEPATQREAHQPAGLAPVLPADFDEATPRFREYVNGFVEEVLANPASAKAHATLGKILEANKKMEAARDCYRNALQLRSNDAMVSYRLCVVQEHLGEPTLAMEACEAAIELQSDFAPAYQRLGNLALEAGLLDKAQSAFEKVIQLEPDAIAGYSGLAAAALQNGEPERAAKLLEPQVVNHPKVKMPRYLLGLAYRSLGRLEEAERELAIGAGGRMVQLVDDWSTTFPRHYLGMPPEARVFAARSYLEEGAPARAAEMIGYGLEWYPDSVPLLNEMGRAMLSMGKASAASTHLRKAEQIEPGNADTQYLLAKLMVASRDYVSALRHVDRAMAAESEKPGQIDMPDILITKGSAHLHLGQMDSALDALDRAIEASPDAIDAIAGRATVLMQLGRHAEAAAAYRQAISLKPGYVQAYLALSNVLILQGDLDGAAAALQKAESIQHDHPHIQTVRVRLEAARYDRLQQSP